VPTLKEAIDTLMDLQSIDREMQILDKEMAAGMGELDNRRSAIEEHKNSAIEYTERLEAGDKRQRELEGQIEDNGIKLKDRQAKLMSVQTNREYQSILKEIEDTKQLNTQQEDELVLLMEQTESIKVKIAEHTSISESEEAALAEESAKVTAKAKKLENKKNKIKKTRNQQAKKVPQKYLSRYERLRENRNGIAVAAVTNGVCSGCNMNIPPQLFNNLLKEDEILDCPTCNRMMFHLPAVSEE
jgi:predicted  nucleic acid-binding Zn-ribbon protein